MITSHNNLLTEIGLSVCLEGIEKNLLGCPLTNIYLGTSLLALLLVPFNEFYLYRLIYFRFGCHPKGFYLVWSILVEFALALSFYTLKPKQVLFIFWFVVLFEIKGNWRATIFSGSLTKFIDSPFSSSLLQDKTRTV